MDIKIYSELKLSTRMWTTNDQGKLAEDRRNSRWAGLHANKKGLMTDDTFDPSLHLVISYRWIPAEICKTLDPSSLQAFQDILEDTLPIEEITDDFCDSLIVAF